jgi:hypothetical protein
MENQTLPARPCLPVQDNLGRLVAPIPGMTKEEVVLLQILQSCVSNPQNKGLSYDYVFEIAVEFTELYFNHFKNKQNGKQQSGIIS